MLILLSGLFSVFDYYASPELNHRFQSSIFPILLSFEHVLNYLLIVDYQLTKLTVRVKQANTASWAKKQSISQMLSPVALLSRNNIPWERTGRKGYCVIGHLLICFRQRAQHNVLTFEARIAYDFQWEYILGIRYLY